MRKRLKVRPSVLSSEKLHYLQVPRGVWFTPAVVFRGEIENDRIDRADDQLFKRWIKRESLPVLLNVQPRVPGYNGKHFLPAADIKASQQWHGLDSDLATGDSLGRSLTIQADGLPATALPDDLFNLSNDNITVYADKAQKENSVIGDRAQQSTRSGACDRYYRPGYKSPSPI